VTDFQLADEESPARVEFHDPLGSPFTAVRRPQEAFVPHMVDASVRRINRFARSTLGGGRGPRAGLRLAVATGDLADNQQLNDACWVRTLLEGGLLDPNSGLRAHACVARAGASDGAGAPAAPVQPNSGGHCSPGFHNHGYRA
jgi:hypothetical protein